MHVLRGTGDAQKRLMSYTVNTRCRVCGRSYSYRSDDPDECPLDDLHGPEYEDEEEADNLHRFDTSRLGSAPHVSR